MRILDRYVIVSFVKNYVISFMVLVGMYVVLDMVFNFNSMVQFQSQNGAVLSMFDTLADMGDYYFYQCFLFFVHLSGIIPVVAAAFTLTRLSRFNELTAMLAAGVPLLRIAMPIVMAALLLNALLLVDQEYLIPNMIPKLVREHGEIHQTGVTNFTINFMQDSHDGLLHVARYHPRGVAGSNNNLPTMERIDVLERVPVTHEVDGVSVTDLQPVAHISADWAFWNARSQTWDLQNGTRVQGLTVGETRSPELKCDSYRSDITPEEINLYRSGNYVDLLGTSRINELLARPKSYGMINLLRTKHGRFTQPVMNVILLLLCIPCVLTREPGKLKAGATKCLFFMGMGLGSMFLSQQLAGATHPPFGMGLDQWTALMAWLPIFLFGPTSVYLLEKIKT